MVDKRRAAGVVSSENLVAGDVEGGVVFLLDDLIAGGGTMQRAALALRQSGAVTVLAFAAHGLFTGSAAAVLDDGCLSGIAITDSVPPFRLAADVAVRARLSIASIVPAFAQAIAASHETWRHKR
ncbi:ribose-phosphate pyrophosphokinase [Rhodoferax lacus]|nr:ribose-phosphate pyrophosphokinase [Rhodoferax lacus]